MAHIADSDWWLFCCSPGVLFGAALALGWKRWTMKSSLRRILPLAAFLVAGGLIRWTEFFRDSFVYFSLIYCFAWWLLIENRDNPGIVIFSCGAIANALAALLNDGKMPVRCAYESVSTFLHQSMTSDTKVWWLCDWIETPNGLYMESVGDLLLILGSALFFTHELLLFLKNRSAKRGVR